ncbi:hypothetical protein OH492_15985 [Vibrio chagasii]|nr:hypothetical protein [Vibrio chagasii]
MFAYNLGRHLECCGFPLPLSSKPKMHTYWLMWHPKYDNDSNINGLEKKAFRAMQKSSYNISMTEVMAMMIIFDFNNTK